MRNWKRILGAGVSAALLLGTLAGCADQGGVKAPDQTGTAGPSASPTATTTGTGEIPLVETEDVIQKLVGIPRDTTIFTVDGKDVTAEQFYYWLGYTIDSVGYYYFGSADGIDWTQEQEGKPIAQYILDSAKQTAQLYSLMEAKAEAEGVALTDADKADLNEQITQTMSQMEGEEGYAKWLQQIAMSDEGFRHMYSVSFLYNHMRELLFGENGKTKPTSEAVVAMAEEQGRMLAKHILIKTVDDNREPLPEEAQAAAKTKAEGILAQLKAASGDEQLKLFDQLMSDNSEDGRNADGTLAAPDGYLFGAGEMVQEFEDATKALEYGQISDLVETTYGYHIILRLTPDNSEMRATWVDESMNDEVDAWMLAAKVEDAPEMEKVDVKGFYEKLSAYRTSLEPAPSETPAPTETPAASEPPASTGTPAPTETPAG